jgi:Flp pilus assembly protein TadD
MIRSRWIGLGIVLTVALILGACGSQWLAGGKLHFDQKRYEKALENFQKAVVQKPNSGEAHLWLARSLAELDRDDEAIKELEKARELDPLQEDMVQNTFVSYWSRRFNSALTYAKNAEEEQHAGDEAHAREDLGKAEERFRRAVLYRPDSVQNYSNLGKVLYRLGRRDEGLAMFHKAKELSANRPDLQRFLFHLFRELGLAALEHPSRENLQRALGLLLDASSLPADKDQLAEIHLNIAESYRGLADSAAVDQKPELLQKSADYYNQVLAEYADDVDALDGLAKVQADLGQVDAALSTAQKRLDLEPWNRAAHLTVYRIIQKAKGENDREAKAHYLFLEILENGKPQAKEGMRTWAVKEFGPMSDMIRTLRDRGDPETMREYTPAGVKPIYMWAYWTGGRAYIFQDGKEVYRLGFKAVPRENVPEELLQ